jgi:hypothetical protein
LFVGAGAAIAIIYSSLFGRRADAHANKILNVVKSILLIGSVALLTGSAVFASHSALSREMLPPLPQAISAVGAIGLATNILFNLAWQFVDNSSWQSFNSGEATDQKGMRRDLNRSALWVFITVNSLGTLIGSLMRGVGGVTSNNILVKMSQAVPHWNEAFAIAICILVFASMVSLVDVIVLAITQALVVDISILNQKMPLVRRRHARFAVLLVGIFAAWGVQAWVSWLGGSIFNFVYIVVIAQLSLIGPVLIGLLRPSKVTSRMWLAILAGAVIGFLSSILGTVLDMATLVNGAGVFAVSASIAGAVFLEACAYRKARAC